MIKINSHASWFFLLLLTWLTPIVPAHGNYVTYRTYFEESPEGVYEKEGFIFLIADIKITTKRVSRSHWEGKAMLRVNELLKQYSAEKIESPDALDIQYRGAVRERIQDFIATGEITKVSMSDVSGRILVNSPKGDNYRYVFATPLKTLTECLEVKRSQIKEVGFLVKTVFEQAKDNELYEELTTFYLELGLFEDALFYQKKALAKDYCMINYYRPRDPFAEREAVRELIKRADLSAVNDSEMLARLPACSQIINRLVASKYRDKPMAQIAFYFTSIPDTSGEIFDASYKNISQNLEKLQEGFDKIREYSTLIKETREKMDKEFFAETPVLKYAGMTLGHLQFDTSLSDKSNAYFEEAKILFQQGKEPERIKKLLIQSISESPRHNESWNYLGAVLTATGKVREALIMHAQAYQIDNSEIETMANLADCYYRLDYKGLAHKYTDHLKMLNEKVQNPFVNKIINKINR